MNLSPGDTFYGWDEFYKMIESDVNKKADVLVALFHFVTKDYNCSCANKTLSAGTSGRLLPANWNAKATEYSLLYVRNSQQFQLLGRIDEEGELQISIKISKEKGYTLWVNPEKLLVSTTGSNIDDLMPSAWMIDERYRKELLDPAFPADLRWLGLNSPRPVPFPRRGGIIHETFGSRPSSLGL